MHTSLSTGCVESSSSFERLGASPSSEDFHGTSASDFGESSLPSTDMPDICTSPFGFLAFASAVGVAWLAVVAEALAGFFALPTAAVRGGAGSSAWAEPLATSNDTEMTSARYMCAPSEHGCAGRRPRSRPACHPASRADTTRSSRGRRPYTRDTGRRESAG